MISKKQKHNPAFLLLPTQIEKDGRERNSELNSSQALSLLTVLLSINNYPLTCTCLSQTFKTYLELVEVWGGGWGEQPGRRRSCHGSWSCGFILIKGTTSRSWYRAGGGRAGGEPGQIMGVLSRKLEARGLTMTL